MEKVTEEDLQYLEGRLEEDYTYEDIAHMALNWIPDLIAEIRRLRNA